MTRSGLLKMLVLPALLVGASSALAQQHTNLFTCYAYVHDGCYVGTDSPCSEEDYNDFLDSCHDHYPNENARRPTLNQALLPTQQVIMSRAYKARMQQLRSELSK